MADRPFEFDLFRLVIVEPDVFDFIGAPVNGDAGILQMIQEGCASTHDVSTSGAKNHWKWSLRDFDVSAPNIFGADGGIVSTRYARSLIEQNTAIVTDESIVEGTSHAEPAAALPIRIVFYMQRHLVAVEHSSAIMSSLAWVDALHQIFDKAAIALNIRTQIRLEPVPEANEVMEAFRSFERLTQLRVTLRLPNPEVSRFAKSLFDQMTSGGIREYLNDIKNGSGLSQAEGQLPHAIASLAQDGYKKGEVVMSGLRQGRRTRIKTGRTAARGQVERVRDFVRGQVTIAKTKEAQTALAAILEEIDNMHPAPEPDAERG